jgi:hypothetical protein
MNLIYEIIQAIQTSSSDNLKYAPSGTTVIEKTVSLAKKLEELYSKETEEINYISENAMVKAIFLGTLSREQDTFSLEENLEAWVKKVVLIGKEFHKENQK